MNSKKKNNTLDKMGLGQIKLVEDWLKKYSLPYKRENIKRIVNQNEVTKAFEVLLDRAGMLYEYKDEKLTPDFLKSGNIRIIITL